MQCFDLGGACIVWCEVKVVTKGEEFKQKLIWRKKCISGL